MTGPRTKRQFAGASADPSQRQITSFFDKSSASADDDDDNLPARPLRNLAGGGVLQPQLPAHIQSNLISVGMRVRKSVPEGYKTGSKLGGFSLWTEQEQEEEAPFLAPRSPAMAKKQHMMPVAATAVSVSTAGAGIQREILPFCGLHTIGGLSVQPAAVPGMDDFPSLSSSQETVRSTGSLEHAPSTPVLRPLNRRKRSFVEDDEHISPQVFLTGRQHDILGNWADEEISPLSMAPLPGRVMAVPRGHLARLNGQHNALVNAVFDGIEGVDKMPGLCVLGQENMAVDDFEEAAFLAEDAMDIEDF